MRLNGKCIALALLLVQAIAATAYADTTSGSFYCKAPDIKMVEQLVTSTIGGNTLDESIMRIEIILDSIKIVENVVDMHNVDSMAQIDDFSVYLSGKEVKAIDTVKKTLDLLNDYSIESVKNQLHTVLIEVLRSQWKSRNCREQSEL